jgi:hypothetical protein
MDERSNTMSRYIHSTTLTAPADSNGDPRAEKVLVGLPIGKELTIAHGFDNALGFFIDIDVEDGEFIELSSFFTGLNNGLALGLLVALNIPLTEKQRLALAGDLPY